MTRPHEQAAETARLLRAAGHDVLLDPLLEISRLPAPMLEPGEVAAVAVTSANATPAANGAPADLPVFVVGEATAGALRAAGRRPAGIAGGDGAPRGTDRASGAGRRRSCCISAAATCARAWRRNSPLPARYRPAVVYEAVAASRAGADDAAAIRERRLDAVLLYSPRSAALLAAHVRAAGLERELRL